MIGRADQPAALVPAGGPLERQGLAARHLHAVLPGPDGPHPLLDDDQPLDGRPGPDHAQARAEAEPRSRHRADRPEAVVAHTAEYWASDEPKPLVLFKCAKAAIGGGRPNVGEARTVDLDD